MVKIGCVSEKEGEKRWEREEREAARTEREGEKEGEIGSHCLKREETEREREKESWQDRAIERLCKAVNQKKEKETDRSAW